MLQKADTMTARHRVAAIGSALLAASIPLAPDMPSDSTVRDLMHAVVNPPSVIVFAVGWETPESDKEWAALLHNAARLADAAKTLSTHAPAASSANWVLYTRAMGDAAGRAGAAAQSKNLDAARRASNALYEACEGCHFEFMKL